jgi:hypothetical protein
LPPMSNSWGLLSISSGLYLIPRKGILLIFSLAY